MQIRKKITTSYILEGRRVPAGTPGAEKITTESKKWYAVGAPLPRGRAVPLSRDHAIALRMAAELETRLERAGAGLPDLTALKRPLQEWIEDWHRTLTASPGSDPIWCQQVVRRLTRLADGCRWRRLTDIDGDRAARWLAEQRAKPSRTEGQLGQQTCNHYRAHLHAFCAWLCVRGVLTSNPADSVPVGDVQADLRQARRQFAAPDLSRFLSHVKASQRIAARTSGQERYILYLLACATGFRRSELWALRPSWFDLDGSPPTVTLPGKRAKNKRTAVQPLPASIVPELRAYLAGRAPDRPLWRDAYRNETALVLKRDLADAGIPYTIETPEGPRRLDFHALRHTFITALIDSGATAKEAQTLARHSTPTLTIGRYTHADPDALAARVNMIPLTAREGPRTLDDLSRTELVEVCETALKMFAALLAARNFSNPLQSSQLCNNATQAGVTPSDATS